MSEHPPQDTPNDESTKPHAAKPPSDDTQDKSEVDVYTQTSADDLKQYIKAATDATERSRRVLIILITASVLALVATWNSRSASWFSERYRVINAAATLLDEKSQLRPMNDPKIIALQQEGGNLYERAQQYLQYRQTPDRNILLKRLEALDLQRVEHVSMVRMPFFGVGFDINDIGIFAGFTFAVVLLWFRFSLLREVNNLRLTFFEARSQDMEKSPSGGGGNKQLRFCYDMLAMRQVLTTPKMSPQNNPTFFSSLRTLFWIIISKGLFLLPLAVQLLVMRNDRNSEHIGRMFSPYNTNLVNKASLVLLASIIVLTALCYHLVIKAHFTWKEAANELGLK
ncbi:MAG TPA: hypothetical protein VF527_01975 [Pyrinomonadaceae bacterium]|jgi:hypothetical protein